MSYYDMFLYGSGSRRNSFSPYVRWIWLAIAFIWLAGQTVYLVALYLRDMELYVDVTDFIYYVLTCALIWNNAYWGHNHLDSIFDKMLEMPGVRHRVLSLFVVRLLSAVIGIGVVTSVVCTDLVETLDSQGLDIGLLLIGYLPWYGAYVYAYASFFDLCGIFVWCMYIQYFSFVSQVSVAGVRRYCNCSGERRKLEEVLEDICMDHSDVSSYLNNTWGFNSVMRALFTVVSVFQLNIILASPAEVGDTSQKIFAIRCAALFIYVWMCACFLAAGFLNDVGDMTCTKFYIESVSEGAFDGKRVVCEDGDAGGDGWGNNWSKSRRGKVDSHMLVLIERLTKRTKVANIVVSRATASAIVTLTFSIVHLLVQWNLLD
jgi:hypothetical protein